MSESEKELFVLAVKCYALYERCSPEVGMGPSAEMIARDVAKQVSFEVDSAAINEAAAAVRKMKL